MSARVVARLIPIMMIWTGAAIPTAQKGIDMKMTFKKSLSNGFLPDDDAAQKLYNRAKPGDLIAVNATLPRDQRSLKQHNLYFKVLTHVFENLPESITDCPNLEVFRDRILINIGFCEDRYYGEAGGWQKRAKSIAHAKLGQDEFHFQVWTPSIALIDKMAPGLGEAFNAEYKELIK